MNKKHFPSTFLEVILLSLIPLILTASTYVIAIVFPEFPKELIGNAIYIVYFILFVSTYYLINRLNKTKVGFNLKITRNIFFFGFLILVYQISIKIPVIFLDRSPEYLSKPLSINYILGAILLAPIVEEIIFRGVILKGFLMSYSPKTAIFLSSLLFGLMHLYIVQGIGAFIFGLYVGYIYYKIRSVGMIIILHSVNNAVGIFGSHINNKFGNIKIETITDIYGSYSMYIIGLGILVFIFLMHQFIKNNTSIFKLNEQNRI
ncbi:CPBP family intramembrane glutamic endopeptidase [uncultured Algibacter sp.]|uniref:CPBP family intramembrane glutamic endopeptidase n=1 Tax=uncultured Algibacter sp. TaxID=298659 RepID=UPI0032177ED9